MHYLPKEVANPVRGVLVGAAIGDAIGMPVETWTRPYIMSLGDGKGIQGFIDPVQERVKYDKHLEAGDTTDDWQLTEVVALSLIHSKGVFDLEDCANRHVEAYSQTRFGWGGTTTKAIEQIAEGKRHWNRAAPSFGKGKGLGNGIMMKVSPLAIAQYMKRGLEEDPASLYEDVMQLSRLTHSDDRAGVAAFAVALVIQNSLMRPVKLMEERLQLLNRLIYEIEVVEEDLTAPDGWSDGMASKVSEVVKKVSHVWEHIDLTKLEPKFNALSTLEVALLCFLRYPNDFKSGVLEAVNMGGDTDSQASIVGAMLGANVGYEKIPRNWREFNGKFTRPVEVADLMVRACV